jgi:hypothetical protein
MFIETPPKDEKKLYAWLLKLHERLIQDDLKGSDEWNPPAISAGAKETYNVTVTGATVGDYAIASFSIDITNDLSITAHVSAADTATVQVENHSVGTVDLGTVTVYARVFRRTT